jgi:segregation and condensation protein B
MDRAMAKLPRLFRGFRKSAGASPADANPASPTSGVPAPHIAAHLSADELPAAPDDEQFAQLDRLYREALDLMDTVESEMSRAGELLRADEQEDTTKQNEPRPAPSSSVQSEIRNPKSEIGSLQSAIPRVTPQQIVEAALFVGGTSLTIKRLCTLLKNEFDQHFVEETIDGLNRTYAAENRPYEIRFGTGGYRMELREAFDPVRNRVFGIGPKEVKLNQDALEVLSLVAYQQPITKEAVDDHLKSNASNILRQLLQRQLIAIRRDAQAQDARFRREESCVPEVRPQVRDRARP